MVRSMGKDTRQAGHRRKLINNKERVGHKHGREGPLQQVLIKHKFEVRENSGAVSGLLLRPAAADCLLVFGHGAGAGMRHPFMEEAAGRLAERGIATFLYPFPYMEQGHRRPDHQSILLKTVRSAVTKVVTLSGGLPLWAGGRSMGGRMTSLTASQSPLDEIRGLIFFGFPFHPAGKPSVKRAEHLKKVELPMLFLQGTRDRLAKLEIPQLICDELPDTATLSLIEGADHSFNVLKRSGRTNDEVLNELASRVRAWIDMKTKDGQCIG